MIPDPTAIPSGSLWSRDWRAIWLWLSRGFIVTVFCLLVTGADLGNVTAGGRVWKAVGMLMTTGAKKQQFFWRGLKSIK